MLSDGETPQRTLAEYILCLSDAADRTHHANDGRFYRTYLADAAILLALVVTHASSDQIEHRISLHIRLWGQRWLVGPEHKVIGEAWDRFKRSPEMLTIVSRRCS